MLTWHRDIEKAKTAYQVILLIREYLDSLTAHDLARVPERCRPGRIFDEADIARCSRRLTEEYWHLRGTAADVGVLQEMWSLFLRASVQISRLNELKAASRPLTTGS